MYDSHFCVIVLIFSNIYYIVYWEKIQYNNIMVVISCRYSVNYSIIHVTNVNYDK